MILQLCKYVCRHFSKHVFMAPTVNVPFLKFYNVCYLINRSTGCSKGTDWSRKRSLPGDPHMGRKISIIVQCFSFPGYSPSETLVFPFLFLQLEFFLFHTLQLSPCKHGLVANPTDTGYPPPQLVMRTVSQPLPAARKTHEPEALASCF